MYIVQDNIFPGIRSKYRGEGRWKHRGYNMDAIIMLFQPSIYHPGAAPGASVVPTNIRAEQRPGSGSHQVLGSSDIYWESHNRDNL